MATKHAIDLVFLVDATGSMGEVIDGLKASIRDFFAYLTDEGRNDLSISDWRAKVVGYRDITADEEWIVNNPFVTTREELEAQLDALEAKGGGDPPEDLLDALLVVADMEEPAERGGEADGFKQNLIAVEKAGVGGEFFERNGNADAEAWQDVEQGD